MKARIPELLQPCPMALDDIPNMLQQSPKQHDTCQLQQHQAFSHPMQNMAGRNFFGVGMCKISDKDKG